MTEREKMERRNAVKEAAEERGWNANVIIKTAPFVSYILHNVGSLRNLLREEEHQREEVRAKKVRSDQVKSAALQYKWAQPPKYTDSTEYFFSKYIHNGEGDFEKLVEQYTTHLTARLAAEQRHYQLVLQLREIGLEDQYYCNRGGPIVEDFMNDNGVSMDEAILDVRATIQLQSSMHVSVHGVNYPKVLLPYKKDPALRPALIEFYHFLMRWLEGKEQRRRALTSHRAHGDHYSITALQRRFEYGYDTLEECTRRLNEAQHVKESGAALSAVLAVLLQNYGLSIEGANINRYGYAFNDTLDCALFKQWKDKVFVAQR
jgi:hypothetical protein